MIEMTTREEAQGMSRDSELPKFFAAYQALTNDRVTTQESFSRILEEFFFLTMDAYITGEGDRIESMIRFGVWLKTYAPTVYPSKVFYAVDSVHAYT